MSTPFGYDPQIEVYMQRSPVRFADEVWIRERRAGGMAAIWRHEGEWVLDEPEGQAIVTPSLMLPLGWAQVLGRAFSEVSPPNTATHAHLMDAIGVRDRLLTMLERP